MRDWWYGDKRDVVKWGTVIALARKRRIEAVLQVALYRHDKMGWRLNVDGATDPVPTEVIQHFRKLEDIYRLGADVGVKIEIHKALFQRSSGFMTKEDFRRSYFDDVANEIRKYEKPIIVLLDPDTGIAPETCRYQHVTVAEIQTVVNAMKSDDLLVFYQHARRGDANWRDSTKGEFW
jgi:hypothetical protein